MLHAKTAALFLLSMTVTASAQEYVNGYTYVAPSYYLTPPVVTSAPGYVAAPYYVAQPVQAYVVQPAPVYVAQPAPAYVVQSAPAFLAPAPVAYRGRVRSTPREVEYTLRGPGGQRQKLEIEYNRWGGIKEVEYRRR